MSNNQGIDHIAFKNGGLPLCRNRLAYMSITIERYRADTGTGRYCKRCVAELAKRDQLFAAKEANR